MTRDPEVLKQAIKDTWWAVLLTGIVAAVFGLLLLAHPQKTLIVFAQFLGILWLLGGTLQIGASFTGGDGWGWRLVGGIVGMLAGLFILAHPLFAAAITPVVMLYVLGFAAIVAGVSELMTARGISALGVKWSWGSFFHGLFLIVIGVFLFANSLMTVTVLLSTVGAICMVWGIGLVIYAFQVRKAAK